MIKNIILSAVLISSIGCSHANELTSPTSTQVSSLDAKSSPSTFWLSLSARRWATGLNVNWPFTNDNSGDLVATFNTAKDPALSYMFTSSPNKIINGNLAITAKLSGIGTLIPWDGSVPTCSARVFAFSYSNNWSRNDARWWSVDSFNLSSSFDWMNLSTSLNDPSKWSDVNGQNGSTIPTLFTNAMKNVSSIGITFGGEFFGHGCYGSNQSFVIQSIGVQ